MDSCLYYATFIEKKKRFSWNLCFLNTCTFEPKKIIIMRTITDKTICCKHW